MTPRPRTIAFLFPGQGAQYPGMGKELSETHAEAAAVFEAADDALRFPLSRMCFEGPEDDLKLTENTQPALLATSTAAARVLGAAGIVPAFVAGHSLGEYSALVATGALDFVDAVRTVRNRGRYMQEAVPVGVGAMAAILGLEAERVAEVCRSVAEGEVVDAANFNSPLQTVIAGHRTAVERAVPAAKEAGARRALLLPVSAPFHSSLMLPAERRLAVDLDRLEFHDPSAPVVTNVDAAPATTAAAVKDALRRQPSRPVRWTETVRFLLDSGVDTFVELGPGKVLTGLVRSVEKSVTMLNVENEASLEATLSALR